MSNSIYAIWLRMHVRIGSKILLNNQTTSASSYGSWLGKKDGYSKIRTGGPRKREWSHDEVAVRTRDGVRAQAIVCAGKFGRLRLQSEDVIGRPSIFFESQSDSLDYFIAVESLAHPHWRLALIDHERCHCGGLRAARLQEPTYEK